VVLRSKEAWMGVEDCGTEKTATSPRMEVAFHGVRPSRREAQLELKGNNAVALDLKVIDLQLIHRL
jgi:hypothetical protein